MNKNDVTISNHKNKHFKCILGLILSLILSTPVTSQVNIEKIRTKKSNAKPFSQELTLSGSMYSGNTEALHYQVESRTNYRLNKLNGFMITGMILMTMNFLKMVSLMRKKGIKGTKKREKKVKILSMVGFHYIIICTTTAGLNKKTLFQRV